MASLWTDLYKSFTRMFSSDSVTALDARKEAIGAGIVQPDGMPDLRGGDGFWSGGRAQFRISNDFIDLQSVTNRAARYREYVRLLSVPEVDMALTVYADEACLIGSTKVSTPLGMFTLKQLTEMHKPGDRFMVYAFDQSANDWTIGWAHTPRVVKEANVIRVMLDNGGTFQCTPDHRILLRNNTWKAAGDLQANDELMPFYRVNPRTSPHLTVRKGLFPRLLSLKKGWIHERQLIDEWRHRTPLEKYKICNHMARLCASGLKFKQATQVAGLDIDTCKARIRNCGFTWYEFRKLKENRDRRRVLNIHNVYQPKKVYDLSVDQYENFAGEHVCFHNCQIGENGHMFDIKCQDHEVLEEAKYASFDLWDMEATLWSDFKNLCLMGDLFWENIILDDQPSKGIIKVNTLPADSMYRIETVKGKVLEFQQSKEGMDIEALKRGPITSSTPLDISQSTAIRFAPEQIAHVRLNEDRKTFYPYGVAVVEPARGPAHQLRLMEDSVLIYRLTRSAERKVFYVDVGGIAPARVEAFMDRFKDQFRKKKLHSSRSGLGGASAVEERWAPPSLEEDYFVPIRPNTQTRIDTLPGASNLGEVGDLKYFLDKLFLSLNFPKSYANQEDVAQTRVSLSSKNYQFARQIERLQGYVARGIRQILHRHMHLLGYPPERYADLRVVMTPPSAWKEISNNDVIDARFNRAGSVMGSQMMSQYDTLVEILKYPPEKAREFVSRMKEQKLDELKLQVMGQRPDMLGLGQPPSDYPETGVDANGPNPEMKPDENQPPMDMNDPNQSPDMGQQPGMEQPQQTPPIAQPVPLSEPTPEEIEKYDMSINDYSRDIDREEVDRAELNEI
jgi:hypothetical protein